MTFQYSICLHFEIENDISVNRIDKDLLKSLNESKIITKIFKRRPKPIEYLTTSKKFTSSYISRCPHNFLLENEETFSVRTFKGNIFIERWPSGRRRTPGKCVYGNVSRVRIPSSLQKETTTFVVVSVFKKTSKKSTSLILCFFWFLFVDY